MSTECGEVQERLDYKTEEVLVLKEILRAVTAQRRIDLDDSHRKRLALKGKVGRIREILDTTAPQLLWH